MHRLGLGGILTFDHVQAVKGMGKVQKSFMAMSQSSNVFVSATGRVGIAIHRMAMTIKTTMRGVGAAFGQIGSGLRNLSFAMMPIALGIGSATKKAADFEQQMSNVASIYRKNKDEIEPLIDRAKQLGVESVFTAKQAGEAMEMMARAGADQEQVLAGIGGVLNMAAAEGMELGEASKIVANTIKALGHEWGEAAHVADVFALVSTKANTTIAELGNSFRMGAATASQLGLKVDQAGAAMATIADAGLQGTLAGTTFTAMMTKLAKPSTKAAGLMKNWGVQLHDSSGELRNVGTIIADFRKHIDKLPSRMKRLEAAQELFGRRGARAYNALAKAGIEGYNKLLEAAKSASEGEGVAADMARRRLDNLKGALILLSASVEQASIEIFGEMLGPMKKTVQEATSGLNSVLFAVQDLKKARKEGLTIEEKATKLSEKYGDVTLSVALGIMDAIDTLRAGWNSLVNTVRQAGAWIKEKFGNDAIRNVTATIIKVASLAAAFVPVLLGVGLVTWAIKGGLFHVIKGLWLLFKIAFSKIGLIIAAAIAVLMMFKGENESLFDVIRRVWNGFSSIVKNVWEGALKPFVEGLWKHLKPAIEMIGDVFKAVFGVIGKVLSWFIGKNKETANKSENLWGSFGKAVGQFLEGIAVFLKAIIDFAGQVIEGFQYIAREVNQLLGLAIKPSKAALTEKEMRKTHPLVYAMQQAGAAQEDVSLSTIKELTKQERKLWARRTARYMTPKQIEAISVQTKQMVGPEFLKLLRESVTERRRLEAERGQPAAVRTKVTIDDKRTTNVKSTLCVDGREVGTAMERHKAEINERAGSKTTPWVPRTACEYGAVPTTHESLA